MRKKVLAVIFLVLFGVAFAACEQEGPAERAGEKIDESVERAGEKVEELGESMQKKAD